MSERRRNHGSRARIPGGLFRAMAGYYLETRAEEVTREGLARQIAQRLGDDGIEYHVRTVRRQILGVVASVPPEVETTLKEIVLRDLGLDEEKLTQVLAERGHVFEEKERLSPYVPIERLHPLTQLWLYHHRGQSKRTLARRLAKDLKTRGVKLSFDSLQGKLAGKGHLVRREVIDQIVAYLEPQGIHSEADAIAHREAGNDEISQSLEGRQFTTSERFRKLCRLWQLKHREGSSRRLAQMLRDHLESEGVKMSITHLQRAIGGKTPRIRQDLVVAMEELLKGSLPEGRTIDEELEGAQWNGTRNLDLAWVSCAPIAEMAREWLEENPGTSMRQLAIKVAATIRRMGYNSSHNTVQPILGAWKKKTRGYVYRAMLKQFPGSWERAHSRRPPDRSGPGFGVHRGQEEEGEDAESHPLPQRGEGAPARSGSPRTLRG